MPSHLVPAGTALQRQPYSSPIQLPSVLLSLPSPLAAPQQSHIRRSTYCGQASLGREPCPIGVVGEICVAGVQLANGYLNRPRETARAFISYGPDNVAMGAHRLYRTGDLGR